ncbi:MAG: AIPR family protein [Phycisphaerae bacterium]|nr:AIPR family protein [Phycisphaerae bacterium]
MDINASIIDQRIAGIVEQNPKWVPFPNDINKQKSAAFTILCMHTCLDISLPQAAELLTEGGNDAGVDGLHVGEIEDGEFLVTIFQAKYKIENLDGNANFPENGLQKAVATIQVLFDPSRKVTLNPRIEPKIEEIRSLIRDGYIPTIRVILCNNGEKWAKQAEELITQAKKQYGDKVHFVHYNHNSIVSVLQRSKSVDAQLTLNGKTIVEDMNYLRVLVGRVSVQEIQELFNKHGDRLLERNVRRYLGLHSNRVNMAIHNTLCDNEKSDKFYFYNNGITVVCDKFDYNAFQQSDYKIQIKNMQIINGGQTCKTIQETLNGLLLDIQSAYVMVRIYQLAETDKDFVRDITYATNSQNPVDLRDLKSNDDYQKTLELDMQHYGYVYKRYRQEGIAGSQVIASSTVAEAVLAIWRSKPHQAKFWRKEHFGKLYEEIFQGLNAAQAVLATVILRMVENERKRPESSNPPVFLPYASHYIAMLIGSDLLKDEGLALEDISHKNFQGLIDIFEQKKMMYHQKSVACIREGLKFLYGDREVSLQQLAATFRRGDLLEMLSDGD